MSGLLLFFLFTITAVTRGLLQVLSLHSSSRATTKRAGEREVDVLLRFNPDHERGNVDELPSHPVKVVDVRKRRYSKEARQCYSQL
jgi:hypothetical protein